MGMLALALVASRHLSTFKVPLWVVLVAAFALTIGTSLGGWRVVRTLGRGIYPIHAFEGLVSQGISSAIVLVASLVGAPISTTDVVAPALVGVGVGVGVGDTLAPRTVASRGADRVGVARHAPDERRTGRGFPASLEGGPLTRRCAK